MIKGRSQWPRGLRRGSATARLLGLRVRIPTVAWLFVCCERCVLSGRGLYDELINRPEESYRLWCVVVCDLETSWMRRPWPTGELLPKKETIESRKAVALIYYLLCRHYTIGTGFDAAFSTPVHYSVPWLITLIWNYYFCYSCFRLNLLALLFQRNLHLLQCFNNLRVFLCLLPSYLPRNTCTKAIGWEGVYWNFVA